MDGESPDERAIELLMDQTNRAVLSILEEAQQPTSLEEIAKAVLDREIDVLPAEEYERQVQRTMVELHHKRLPKLAGAGIIAYDGADRIVIGTDGPGPIGDSLESGLVEELQAGLGPQAEAGAVEVLKERDAVIEQGRRLADEADNELFLLYVSTDLLEDECIRRAEAAIERGVDISLGSANPEVRELTRRRLPEVTVWEPQLDWTNAHSQYPRVGRLVLVDREAVMLAVLQEPRSDGNRQERALVGRGSGHPLVVLVCELLGARLDHLDYQTADFRQELPF